VRRERERERKRERLLFFWGWGRDVAQRPRAHFFCTFFFDTYLVRVSKLDFGKKERRVETGENSTQKKYEKDKKNEE
jgi:hypothetical protein